MADHLPLPHYDPISISQHEPDLDREFYIRPLASAISDGGLKHLKVLDVGDQPLNNKGVSQLAKALMKASAKLGGPLPLTCLRLRCVKMGDDPLGDMSDNDDDRMANGPYYAMRDLCQALQEG